MNYYDFIDDYHRCKRDCETYRLGQHFINLFISDSSSDRFKKLWNERNFKLARFEICEIIIEYGWDFNSLPLIKKD